MSYVIKKDDRMLLRKVVLVLILGASVVACSMQKDLGNPLVPLTEKGDNGEGNIQLSSVLHNIEKQSLQVPLTGKKENMVVKRRIDEGTIKKTPQKMIEKHLLKYKVKRKEAKEWAYFIVKYSDENKVDPYTILAIMQVETGRTFNPDLVGKDEDVGLMQIRPIVQNFLKVKGDRAKPELNIKLGCMYLSYTQKKFKDKEMGIVAYNQGEGNIARGTYNTRYLTLVKKALDTIEK